MKKSRKAFGLSANEISAGRSIILCTDKQEDIASISFASRQIKFLGKLLASADLQAQLSDQIYLEKLLFLFHECREAGVGNYKRESDIIEKALPFYDVFEDRLKSLKLNTGRHMRSHFDSRSKIDENLYRVAIKRHKKYLTGILSSKDADPRHHLRRGGIVATVRRQYGSQDCSNWNKSEQEGGQAPGPLLTKVFLTSVQRLKNGVKSALVSYSDLY